jgi:hypothetical protein
VGGAGLRPPRGGALRWTEELRTFGIGVPRRRGVHPERASQGRALSSRVAAETAARELGADPGSIRAALQLSGRRSRARSEWRQPRPSRERPGSDREAGSAADREPAGEACKGPSSLLRTLARSAPPSPGAPGRDPSDHGSLHPTPSRPPAPPAVPSAASLKRHRRRTGPVPEGRRATVGSSGALRRVVRPPAEPEGGLRAGENPSVDRRRRLSSRLSTPRRLDRDPVEAPATSPEADGTLRAGMESLLRLVRTLARP